MQIFKIVWLEFQWILAELKWICFNELNAYQLYNLQKMILFNRIKKNTRMLDSINQLVYGFCPIMEIRSIFIP